jgi:hypothetical protein
MVGPHLRSTDKDWQAGEGRPLGVFVRGTLLGIALGLTVVFAVAAWLNPYDEFGLPRRMETHRQLGLPPCTFQQLAGVPCPSCGMTTSFAFMVRGDLVNAVRANAVGALLAMLCMACIPWSLACAIGKRTYFIRSMEKTLIWLLAAFLTLLMARWGIVVLFGWW